MMGRILDIHECTLSATPAAVRALMRGLGGPDDRLWPERWPPLRLADGLCPGSSGGHGPIAYTVHSVTDDAVVFAFQPMTGFGKGLEGTHRFELQVRGPERVVLRHVLDGRAVGAMRVKWPLFVRPLHAALIEAALARARAELLVGRKPDAPALTLWVRALRRLVGIAMRRRA